MTSALELEGVTLINRGIALWGQGQREDAVQTMRQGVAVCRAAEAIPVLEHSIKIRRIYRGKSHEFTADLAGTLKNLGSALHEAGSQPEAITALTESVSTYRALIEADHPEYRFPLARALNGLGNARGLVAGTMNDFDEAITLLRAYDLEHFDDAAMLLAAALASQCGILLHQGNYPRALDNVDEAVAIFRRLGTGNPAGVEPYLAKALTTRAEALVRLERFQDAHTAATEALNIIRRCYTVNPDGWRKQLITTLQLLAPVLRALDRPSEAADLNTEIDRLIEEDSRDDKPLHRPEKPKGFLARLRRKR
jgi:tetratricopeptide (TPR) repeat protein